jgi:DNA-binding CsgD family transcriptional regulator
VTDARTQSPGFDQRTLARVAGSVAELPAVATQDWVDEVAETLAGVDPWCRVGVSIAHVESGGQVRTVEAVGVKASPKELEHMTDPKAEMLSVHSRLERLTDLGVALPSGALSQGLAATADDLGAWKDGPLGRIWGHSGLERLMIGLVPLGRENADRVLLLFLALGSGASGAPRASARTLAALIPLLAKRAWMALPPSGPIAWMTDREQDVLDRLILGRSVRNIADELGRSPHTVHDHVKSLHRKLNASSRGELVARALGHSADARADIEPVVIERTRAAAQIEPTPPATIAARRQ